jgi:hypothetical protein
LRERASARALQGSLISLAALVGSVVRDATERPVGHVRDVVVHWTRDASHPAVKAVVIRTGKTDVMVAAGEIELRAPGSAELRSEGVYARVPERHSADVELAHDVLDRQIVDTDGLQLVRPSDVYLVEVRGRVEVAGIEVGAGALLRRIGPKRLRGRFRPERVIDWAKIRAFAPARPDEGGRGRRADLAGKAGAGLALDVTAAEMRAMRAGEIETALKAAEETHEVTP